AALFANILSRSIQLREAWRIGSGGWVIYLCGKHHVRPPPIPDAILLQIGPKQFCRGDDLLEGMVYWRILSPRGAFVMVVSVGILHWAGKSGWEGV
ncbi:hypothetical protein CVT26_014319, partial [Gymnopilus dilepis]